MKIWIRLGVAVLLTCALTSCGSTEALPEPEPTLSFEELQSQYANQVGAIACVQFMGGNYEGASRYFRILEAIVPTWEGYADGVLREGKSFDARLCY